MRVGGNMTSLRNKILGIKTEWVIMDENGKILERFRLNATATLNLTKYIFDGTEKLHIEEVVIK